MRPDNLITRIAVTAITLALAPFTIAQDVDHGRISYADDDGLIKGTEDAEWSIARLNSLVMPGDTIWADEKGVLEVEVSGGSFLRLADGSKIEIVSMPPSAHIKGWSGSFYIQRLSRSEGNFTFKTPVGEISVESDTQVRIDILEEGSTTVAVRWGNVIVRTTEGESVRVGSGHRVYIDPGYLPSTPTSFDRGQEDSFDTWNRERSRKIARGANLTNIGSSGSYSTPIGAYDLNEYGNWINVDGSYYWSPTVVTNYVPYRVGSWSYIPRHGHVWVGHHPFTYITSHHGYWSHHNHHGWIWSYNRTYSPAYVASVYHNDTFIWAPLGHHGDAVYHSGSYFTAGGFHFSIGYSTYAHSGHLYGGHHNVYALNHHSYIDNHHYYDADRWNVCANTSQYYPNRPRRNPYGRSRDYAPTRVMRGPAQTMLGSRTYSARDRIAVLESRSPRTVFKTASVTGRSPRTSTRSSIRSASPRVVTFNQDPVQKLASRSERLKRVPTRTTNQASTARVNRTSRAPRTTTIGTINDNQSRTLNPRTTRQGKDAASTPSDQRTFTIRPNPRVTNEQKRIRSTSPTVRQPASPTPSRATRTPSPIRATPQTRTPSTSSRTKSTIGSRPIASIRTPSSPSFSRPTITLRTPVRNSRPSSTSRPQIQSRPAPSRPSISSTPRSAPAPSRPSISNRPSAPPPSRSAAPTPRSSSSSRSGISQQRSYSPPPSRSAPRSSPSRSISPRGGRR